ncbi:MAG: RuBisCO large subunit C-terminal-like domain-containing protein [Thermoplasmata archaeon]|nr:RuBisCO large subunit C-terminal-like domain-containing protein [Thermoplasmata archaeon]
MEVDWIEAIYRIDSDMPLEKAARIIAMEESTGTWTEVRTTDRDLGFVTATVGDIDERARTASVIYPLDLFEPGNVPQLLSVVAGNLFGLEQIRKVRLEDVIMPHSYVRRFPGPRYGIEGMRHLVGSERRPHVGTIVKPKVGLTPAETAKVAFSAALGGVDLIKDDETLTDQAFCPMTERIPEVMEVLDKVWEETGRNVSYAVNVTAGPEEVAERADIASKWGANMLMIDVLTSGFTGLLELRRETSLPIHVHRAMHGAITRDPDHGISMKVISRLVRMLGGDQFHVGAITGKMDATAEEVLPLDRILTEKWHGLRPTFPVASGGLHPGCVADEVRHRGMDIIMQAGGGIHGHPAGTRRGAMAMRQAVEAVTQGRTLEEFAVEHEELRQALEKWGVGKKEEYYAE